MNKIKPRGPNVLTCPVFLDRVVRHLFPEHRERPTGTGLTEIDGAAEPSGVTKAEVKMTAKKISIRKAPGLDGIPGLAIKPAALNVPHIFVDTFNACLQEGIFPAQWKLQRLLLIAKGKKPLEEPSSYRPLCMLDMAGKLFERVRGSKLDAAILEAGGLSDNQLRFRKGRSTIDAIDRLIAIAADAISGSRCTKRMCAVICLDIRNAFHSARWDHIMESLEQLKVPLYLYRVISSYLTSRTLLYDTDDGTNDYKITRGVLQGSVLGPPGWNVLYDGLLRQPLPEGASIVAFADDVALIVVAKSIDDIQHLGDEAIEVVADWLSRHGLSLAAEKTEVVLIARTKKRKYATFTVEDKMIRTVDTIKYLKVTIDARLTFKEHLRNAGLKASQVTHALAGIMPNIGGPKQPRRALFSMVVTSVILYGAPIWAKAMSSHTSYGAPCLSNR